MRSRRIFRTTSAGNTHGEDPMEVDAISRKGKGTGNSGKGKKGGEKGKESHSGKEYGETTTEHSRFDGECRNCGKYGHKTSDCWYKQTNKSQGKGKGTGKSKSKVTEISERDNSELVDDWCPSSNTSAQQPNLSQVNTHPIRWKFLQYLHLHLRLKNTHLKCEVKECTRKHSGSKLSGQRSAELLDAGMRDSWSREVTHP